MKTTTLTSTLASLLLTAAFPALAEAGPRGTKTAIHVVRSGQTLSRIALDYQVERASILTANPEIQDPDQILIGQRITIPLPTAEYRSHLTYQIQFGDSLDRLARRFEITSDLLAAFNGIADKDVIVAGHLLSIPNSGGSVRPAAPLVTRTSKTAHTPVQQSKPAPAPEKHPSHLVRRTTFVVSKPGETIGSLIKTLGITEADIRVHNRAVKDHPIDKPLPMGMALQVPYSPLVFRN